MGSNRDWGVDSQTLTIPPFAGPNDPQIAIGPDIPADLQAFYTAQGTPVVGAIIFRTNAILYTYEAIVSGGAGTAVGTSRNGVVAEYNILSTLTGAQSRQIFGNLTAAAVEFGSPSGTPTGSILNINAPTGKLTITDGGGLARTLATANETVRGAGANGTTVAAGYAAMPGTPGTSITKQFDAASTAIRVFIACTAFMSVGVAELEIGIQINATDTTVTQFFFSNTGIRHQLAGEVKVTGLAAGTYVCAMRWRRTSGAGTINWSTVDSFSLTLEEVAV